MSAVINDALGDTENDNESIFEDCWPEVPCCLVHKEELDLIICYCSHFNYVKDFDTIPQPIPRGGVENMSEWLKDEWEQKFIQNIKTPNLVKLL